MRIWKAMHNPCVHESGYETISLHKSKKGAETAVVEHKKKQKKLFGRSPEDWEQWDVEPDKLLD